MTLINSLVNDIIKMNYEYISSYEISYTYTEENIVRLKIETEQLLAKQKIAEYYFKNQLQERKRLFVSATKVLDKAIKDGDSEWAQMAIKMIKITCKKSPFSFNT